MAKKKVPAENIIEQNEIRPTTVESVVEKLNFYGMVVETYTQLTCPYYWNWSSILNAAESGIAYDGYHWRLKKDI